MFVLLVELTAKASAAAELESVLRSLVDVANEEPGIEFYSVQRPQTQEPVFILYERYTDRAAWTAHLEHEPAKQLLQCFDALLAGPPKVTFCDAVAETARST